MDTSQLAPPESTSFLFVLGTGRCGSTLVQEILARHSSTAFLSNLEDRWSAFTRTARWNGTMYRHLPARATTKGRLRYAPSEGYLALDREVSHILSTPFRDLTEADASPWLSERFRRFFEKRAQLQGQPLFVHKFTGWPRARFVHAILPAARFIHVVRDGRAVANSWLQMPWWRGYEGPEHWQWGQLPDEYGKEWDASGRSFVLLAGLLWKLLMDAFAEAQRRVPSDQWLEVRYEDVVSQPAASFRRMLEFAGLPFDDEFHSQLSRQPFTESRSFRRDLDAESLALLDRSLAEHLHQHGYPAASRDQAAISPGEVEPTLLERGA